jgi:ATP-binding protein involved in chromosome partitioning
MQTQVAREEDIINLLKSVKLSDGSLVTELMSKVIIKDDKIGFYLSSAKFSPEELEEARREAERLVNYYYPDCNLTIAAEGEFNSASSQNKSSQSKAQSASGYTGPSASEIGKKQQSGANSDEAAAKYNISKADKIIAVTSGKGGVGKSSTVLNLAAVLKNQGFKVGVADLDIHGPSVPTMLGAEDHPEVENEKFTPLIANGIKAISMGNLLKKNQALPWRGPMSIKAMHQLLLSTDWGELDYLLVDMPPGTSDVHMSFAENYNIYGVVVVTTPQQASVEDVQKNIIMLEKYKVHILGVVENMSGYKLADSQDIVPIFGSGGGRRLADLNDLELIAQVPIYPEFTEYSEKGEIASEYNSEIAEKFRSITTRLERKREDA